MNKSRTRPIWRVAEEDRAKTSELAHNLGIPRIAAGLLTLRGIRTVEEGERFLAPSISHLSDPRSLTDMDRAVTRIEQARARDEKVLVFGDYDVDGIAGTVILLNALRRYGIAQCGFGMPSRMREGYGLGAEHVNEARADGVTLIITVDNGINAREAAEAAAEAGVDLIVTDHHQLEGSPPRAAAVVNPKREAPGHPAADAAGAGVAFKLAWALTGEVADLDLAALGTVADIVPLRGENRVLAAAGLAHMARQPRIGLAKLAIESGIDITQITAEKIAFQLGPRLNAGGRLGDGILPLTLLMTDSADDAVRIAAELSEANEQRRDIEREIFDQAVAKIEESCFEDKRSIVLAGRGWHPGVIGIVASRLQARYRRPVVLVAVDEDGVGRGSARSPESFDMAGALAACKRHLVRFGGHAAAAGLALAESDIPDFCAAFEIEAQRRLPDGQPSPVLDVDAQVSLSEIDGQLVSALDKLEPFGCMNPLPVFCSYAVEPVPNSYRVLQGGHVRLAVRQGSRVFGAVGFRMAESLAAEVCSQPLDIAFSPRFNTWRGETSIQLILKDARPSEDN